MAASAVAEEARRRAATQKPVQIPIPRRQRCLLYSCTACSPRVESIATPAQTATHHHWVDDRNYTSHVAVAPSVLIVFGVLWMLLRVRATAQKGKVDANWLDVMTEEERLELGVTPEVRWYERVTWTKHRQITIKHHRPEIASPIQISPTQPDATHSHRCTRRHKRSSRRW